MRVRIFIVSFMAVSFLIGSGVVSASTIVINEILQNPSKVADQKGEWFELYNAGDSEVDLSGWTIKDNGSDDFTISGSLTIAPHGFLVFARNGDFEQNGQIPVVDYVYSGFTLANGNDEIILLNASNETIDEVWYDGGLTFPDPDGASIALLSPTLDNNVGSNWYEESTFTYGLGDYGTPGMANVPIPGTLLLISSGLAAIVAWRKRLEWAKS